MPIVQISIVEGRGPDQIRSLISEVTEAVSRTLEAPVDTVRVLVTEVAPNHWGSGAHTIAEKRAASATREDSDDDV